ncbi:MAG: hypothetical protein WA136_09820 [Rhodoferax sp.]
MFTYKTYRLDNNLSLPVGIKFNLAGKIIYGSPKNDLVLFKRLCVYIKDQSPSENIVIDLSDLEEWHSIALKELIPLVSEINKAHIVNKRTPVSIIGPTTGDVYWAVEEKHKADLDNGLIPWLSSFEEYKSKNSKFSIVNVALITNPI